MSQSKYIRKVDQLIDKRYISEFKKNEIDAVAEKFQISISPHLQSLINEPEVQKQYIPSANENNILKEELRDPIGDEQFTPVKGITHRYPDRVLFKPLHTCNVYCRFCFRREKVGQSDEILSSKEFDQAFEYIRSKKEIWEVILTGGDPLTLSASKLSKIIKLLEEIDHVKIIRIHTRLVLASPEKIDSKLLSSLQSSKAVYMIIHCNSHKELSTEVCNAIQRINQLGIPLMSQSVLLKNINDSADKLEKLFRRLVELKVRPYYLHHPDLAQGTSHFRVSLENGRKITSTLRGRLSGIAHPLYVLDVPGGLGKVPAGREFVSLEANNKWKIRTIHDTFTEYQDYL